MMRCSLTAFPPLSRRLLGDLLAPLGLHTSGPRLSAHTAKRDSGGVFAAIRRWFFVDLSGHDLFDHDCGADHVGGALFAFRASGAQCTIALDRNLLASASEANFFSSVRFPSTLTST